MNLIRAKDDYEELIDQLREDLSSNDEGGVGIVFCLTTADTERLARVLEEHHIPAAYFHSKCSEGHKEDVFSKWLDKRDARVVCATEAFGLGIDNPGLVSFVHHLQPPISMSCLQQHLGRARSRGSKIECGIWWHQDDYSTAMRVFAGRLAVTHSSGEEERIAADLDEVWRFIFDDSRCRRSAVVCGALPDEDAAHSVQPCNSCSSAECSTLVAPTVDGSSALLAAIETTVAQVGESFTTEKVVTVLTDKNQIDAEVAAKLVFVAIRLGVLREQKLGAKRSLQKGKEVSKLGKEIGLRFRIHGQAAPAADGADSGDTSDAAVEMEMEEADGAKVQAVGSPAPLLRGTINDWSFHARWLAESLITQGRIEWKHIDRKLAQEQRVSGDDPTPLRRLLGRGGWPYLPPPGARYRHTYAASVRMVGDDLQWKLDWPKFVNRFGSAAGRTKRIYELYGCRNVLMIRCEQGGDEGVAAYRRLRTSESLTVAGRTWQKPKARPDKEGHQLIFYATHAEAETAAERTKYQRRLDELNTGPVDEQHFQVGANRDKTLCKALCRCALQTSDVVPTVTIEPRQLVRIAPDEIEERTDGHADIAPDLMEAVWAAFCRKTGTRGGGIVPSIFQGRLCGLKGTWAVKPELKGVIRYRESQKKVEIVDPLPEQLTIEVCDFATDSGPARINQQHIRMLEPRMEKGRLAELLTELLAETLQRDRRALTELADAQDLCATLGETGLKIIDMLDAGHALESELVQGELRRSLQQSANRAFDSGKMPSSFRLQKSRHMMILPDTLGLLEEDEILLRVPQMDMFSGNVVLARNPGYHPGELLKVKCVDPYTLSRRAGAEGQAAALRYYCGLQCVCVLSVKGDRKKGVADKMQGGDYDGDKVTVIWDERIADHLDDMAAPEYPEPELDQLMNTKLEQFVDRGDEVVNDKLWQCMEHMVRRQGGEPTISLVSRLHVNHADRAADDWDCEHGEKAKQLAGLAYLALDMDSAGYNVEVPDALKDCQEP